MTNAVPQVSKTTVFISYAHEQKEFVTDLREALEAREVEPRGDWLLTGGVGYEERLRDHILGAHAFVFIISPDAIDSEACKKELTIAEDNKKPILPVVRVDHKDDTLLPQALRIPHWTFLREEDDFGNGMENLVRSINTDFALMDMHVRLLLAADNWDKHKRNRSYLWGKDGLKNAETWLERVSAQPKKLPQPTPLETEFILNSQRARTRTMRIAFVIAITVAIALIGLSVLAWFQRGVAQANESEARVQTRKAEENLDEAKRQQVRAEKQTTLAEQNFAEARKQQAVAEKQTELATQNLAEARKQQAEALKQKKIAEENLAEAQRQQKEAERQTGIANEQRREAEDRGQKLRKSYSESDYRFGSQQLLSGDIASGVAYLSHAIATDTASTPAADRLFTLMANYNQPLLLRRITVGDVDTMPQEGQKKFDVAGNGELVATISKTGQAALSKADKTRSAIDLKGARARSVEFLPKGDLLVIVTENSILGLRSDDGTQTFTIASVPEKIARHALSRKGDRIVVATPDGAFFMVPLDGNGAKERLAVPLTKEVRYLSFIADDNVLAIVSASSFATWSLVDSKLTTIQDFEDDNSKEEAAIAGNGTYAYTFHDAGGLEEDPYADITIGSALEPDPSNPTTSDKSANWSDRRYEFATAIDLKVNANGEFIIVTLNTDESHLLTPNGSDQLLRHEGVRLSGAHPFKKILFTASSNGSINLWNAGDGTAICAPLWHKRPVVDATFSSTGDYLASITEDGVIYVWDLRPRSLMTVDNTPPAMPSASSREITADHVGMFELVRLKDELVGDTTNAVWELRRRKSGKKTLFRHPLTEQTQNEDLAEHTGFSPTIKAFFSDDGKTVITIAGNSPPRVWRTDSESDSPVFELGGSDFHYAGEVYLTPNGDKALVGYYSNSGMRKRAFSYQIFSLINGKPLNDLISLRLDQDLLEVSKNLDRIIVAEAPKGESEKNESQYQTRRIAFVRDVVDFHALGQAVRHADGIAQATFGKDDRIFCTVSRDGSLRIWDSLTGFPLSEPLIFNNRPPSFGGPAWDDDYFANLPKAVFSSDGQRVSFREPEYDLNKKTIKPPGLTWDISPQINSDDEKLFNDLVKAIYGVRLTDNGALEFTPQATSAELLEKFGAYKEKNTPVGRLIKRLLTPPELTKPS